MWDDSKEVFDFKFRDILALLTKRCGFRFGSVRQDFDFTKFDQA